MRPISKKIDRITFEVVSPKLIKKMGAVSINTAEIYDADGYPVEKGLMDTSMGVIDPGLKCKTCGGRLKTCPGHFGIINLSRPIIHALYSGQVYNFLRSSCGGCGRLTLPDTKVEQWREKINKAKREHDLFTLRTYVKTVIKSASTIKKCPHCETEKKKIKFKKPTTFEEDGARLWPTEIRERLEKIPDEDVRLLGYEPFAARPEWMILTVLAVPPITVRPSITLETGERSEDDLTHKLTDVVRVNQRLLENINAGAPEIIIEDLWDLLQYHISTFFNNNISQIPPARHRTGRQLKTLAQRLVGKGGRFRQNLAGKRVNFSSRSVISPDPFIDMDEVGVPYLAAKELTLPEKVTEWNKKWLEKMIKNMGEYPSANYVISPDGKRKKITKDTKDIILEELDVGWLVERNLLEKDIIIFNRQPSLHRLSMMGHRVRIIPGRTLRLNPIVCVPYNADFDGDEMNLHLPQNEEARAEAKSLLLLRNQIITPRYGESIIGNAEDTLLGLYYLTKNLKLDKKTASQLIFSVGLSEDLPKPAGKNKEGEYWDGKQIFSMLLPKDLNYTRTGKIYKDGKVIKGDVIMKKGQLVQGLMDKDFVGSEGGSLIQKLYSDYSPHIAAEFINKSNLLGLSVSRKIAHTISFYDFDMDENEKRKVKKIIENTHTDAEKAIVDYNKDKISPLPGKTVYETFETRMLTLLGASRTKLAELADKKIKEDSTLVNSARAGAGDKILNIVLMSGFAGQQVLRGERINSGYKDRTLPHFSRGDLSPKARGFIEQGYATGLGPIEFFFNSIVGRDGLMDTAMRTPKSGYMQRRLINALQDLKTSYDGTVRDAGGRIVQFSFGGDNIDVSKSDAGGVRIE